LLQKNDPVDLNYKDEEGICGLHYAIINRNEFMVDLLLSKNADVDAVNKKAENGLMLGC